MSQTKPNNKTTEKTGNNHQNNEGIDNLRKSPMMAYLLDALGKGTDIGHYGRLTFTMIARHFLSDEEIIGLLGRQPDHNEAEAKALLTQVKSRDYNPPKRERILEWQSKQDFPICPDSDDPGSCNVYSELQFPDGIYDNITEYYEEKADGEANHTSKR